MAISKTARTINIPTDVASGGGTLIETFPEPIRTIQEVSPPIISSTFVPQRSYSPEQPTTINIPTDVARQGGTLEEVTVGVQPQKETIVIREPEPRKIIPIDILPDAPYLAPPTREGEVPRKEVILGPELLTTGLLATPIRFIGTKVPRVSVAEKVQVGKITPEGAEFEFQQIAGTKKGVVEQFGFGISKPITPRESISEMEGLRFVTTRRGIIKRTTTTEISPIGEEAGEGIMFRKPIVETPTTRTEVIGGLVETQKGRAIIGGTRRITFPKTPTEAEAGSPFREFQFEAPRVPSRTIEEILPTELPVFKPSIPIVSTGQFIPQEFGRRQRTPQVMRWERAPETDIFQPVQEIVENVPIVSTGIQQGQAITQIPKIAEPQKLIEAIPSLSTIPLVESIPKISRVGGILPRFEERFGRPAPPVLRRQPKRYSPSLFALMTGLRTRREPRGTLTGLELRPIVVSSTVRAPRPQRRPKINWGIEMGSPKDMIPSDIGFPMRMVNKGIRRKKSRNRNMMSMMGFDF